MTTMAQRAHDLVRLAVNPGAAEGEARNAALAACKLIHANDLLKPVQPPWNPEAPRWPEPRAARKPAGPARFISRFNCHCRVCGGEIRIGDRIYWTRERGAHHPGCWA